MTHTNSARPPSITDTTLLLDAPAPADSSPTSNQPSPNSAAAASNYPAGGGADGGGGATPEAGVISAVTVGACALAGIVLVGAIVLRRCRARARRRHEKHLSASLPTSPPQQAGDGRRSKEDEQAVVVRSVCGVHGEKVCVVCVREPDAGFDRRTSAAPDRGYRMGNSF